MSLSACRRAHARNVRTIGPVAGVVALLMACEGDLAARGDGGQSPVANETDSKEGSAVGGAASTSDPALAGGARGTTDDTPCAKNPEWLYCEDFETTALGESPGDLELVTFQATASAEVSNEEHYSGSRAIRLDVAAANRPFAMLRKDTSQLLAMQPEKSYVRMRLRMNQLPQLYRENQAPHYGFLRITPSIEGHERALFASASAQEEGHVFFSLQLGWNEGGSLTQDCGLRPNPKQTLAVSQWMCMEYEVRSDGQRIWLGDALLVDEDVAETHKRWGGCEWMIDTIQSVEDVRFGFRLSAGEAIQDLSVWMDDLVIDDERIGCD